MTIHDNYGKSWEYPTGRFFYYALSCDLAIHDTVTIRIIVFLFCLMLKYSNYCFIIVSSFNVKWELNEYNWFWSCGCWYVINGNDAITPCHISDNHYCYGNPTWLFNFCKENIPVESTDVNDNTWSSSLLAIPDYLASGIIHTVLTGWADFQFKYCKAMASMSLLFSKEFQNNTRDKIPMTPIHLHIQAQTKPNKTTCPAHGEWYNERHRSGES